MKYIILLLTLFIVISSQAQTYNPSLHTVSAKAYGPAQAVPTDARSMYYDAGTFTYRDYTSLSEVMSYLNTATKRTGAFDIFVNDGSGRKTYWFKGGTNLINLILKSTDPLAVAAQITDSLNSPNNELKLGKGLVKIITEEGQDSLALDFPAIDEELPTKTITFTGAVEGSGNVGTSIALTIPNTSIQNNKLAAGIDASKIGGANVSNDEFNRLDGVTSPIQSQINLKQDIITGAATTALTDNLTPNKILVSSSLGKIAVSSYALPSSDGSPDQVLATDGSGNLFWTTPEGGGSGGITTLTGPVTAGPGSGSVATTITDNAITESKIALGAVTSSKIGSNAVTNTHINNGAVTSLKLGTSAVTTNSIADANVTGVKIASKSINLATHVQNINTASILGRTTAGNGDIEQLTGTQATALLDVFTTSTKGVVPVASGGNTTTEFLRKDGTWAAPSGGGGGSGTVNSGTANRLAYYASNGTAVSELAAITANRVLLSNANGLPSASSVTNTTLGYLDATSSIQTQFDRLFYSLSVSVSGATSTLNTIIPARNTNIHYYDIDGDVTSLPNPSNSLTLVDGFKLHLKLTDNGTSRAISGWGSKFRSVSSELPLPTSTPIGQTLYLEFSYTQNSDTWDLVSSSKFSTGGGGGPYYASGTYIATTTNVAQITSSTSNTIRWQQIDSQVFCQGSVGVTTSGAGAITLGFSLPVASNFTAAGNADGNGIMRQTTSGTAYTCYFEADATNDRVNLRGYSAGSAAATFSFSFSYTVL